MAQPRISKGSRSGGRFARKPLATSASFETGLDLGDIETSDADDDYVDSHSPDRSWLDISEEEREALLAETERYLEDLIAKVGEPSPKHIARAQALVDKLNGA